MMQQSNSLHADLNMHLHNSFCVTLKLYQHRPVPSPVMNSKAQYSAGGEGGECIVAKFPGDYYQDRNN